jgi:hypothetical protein
MSKINWDVYAQRRRINLEKLIETQGLTSYSDYLMFCLTVNVNPMSEEDFPLSNTKKVPTAEKSSSSPPKPTATKAAPTKAAPTKSAPKSPAKTAAPDDRWGIKKTKGSSKKTTKKTGK